jgi:hypothetical protein
MPDENKTTVAQTLVIGQMAKADVIQRTQLPGTASSVQPVRTVATTLTTGNVSIRYVPRPAQSDGNSDTGS